MATLLSAACTRPAPPPPAASVTRHGAPVKAGDPQPIATLLAAPDRYKDQPVLVSGTVRAACTRKGCWMELAPSLDKSTPGCRVTFKDYGFFVPTDSQGAQARVEGVAEVRTIPADEVAHLASEGATFKPAADGTAREVRIVATGVELSRPAKM